MKKQNWINFPSGSKKLVNNSKNTRNHSEFNFMEELKPKKLTDLAVHAKKVNEVKEWIKHALVKSKPCPILLLTGPTGCGKTATVHAITKELNLNVTEWINPMDQDEFTQSQLSRFSDFLSESKYCSLLCEEENKIVLIEDYPNFVLNRPEDFIAVLEKYYYTGKSPLILICSDVQQSNLNFNQTIFTQQTKDKLNIFNISFNPISSTLLKLGLKRAQELIKTHEMFQIPNESVINAIICTSSGDIRNALHQFHFAALKDVKAMPIPLSLSTKGRKRKRNVPAKLMEKNETLTLFHALGRVLNPKRITNPTFWRIDCDLNSLINTFSTQPVSFTGLLQENYFKYFGSIHDVQKAADILSLTDNFLSKWSDRHESVLIALWYLVLGLMITNENHVGKWNQICGIKRLDKRVNEECRSKGIRKGEGCYYNLITKTNTFKRFI